MRKIHYNIAYIPVVFLILFIAWLTFPIITDVEGKYPLWIKIFFIVLLIIWTVSILFYPPFLIEGDNGLYVINMLNKRFRKDYIKYDNISKIEYPYWKVKDDDRTRCMRLEINDGLEYLCPDYFTNLSGVIKRWQNYKSIATDVITNSYKSNGLKLNISPNYFARIYTYLILMGIAVCILCVWRMVTTPLWPYPYIVFPLMIATIYALGIPLTQIKVEDDMLKLRNPVMKNIKYDIPLSSIGRMKIRNDYLSLKRTDGQVVNIKHSLSSKQIKLFVDKMTRCGIICESE